MSTDTEERQFTFTFRVENGPLWEHRSITDWAADLLRTAGHITFEVSGESEGADLALKITAPERSLRLIGVALNLHAEQTPWDSTPAEQARALEAVLSAPDDTLPDNPHGMVKALELARDVFLDEDFRSQMVGWSDAGLSSVVDRLNDVIGLAGDWVRDYEGSLHG